MSDEKPRTVEEQRQAVIFSARYEYAAQEFWLGSPGMVERWTGDPFDLPPHVEPVMGERRRWEYWREVLPHEWTDAQVDAYQFKHWCGGFALFNLHMAGLALDVTWKDSVGFCEPQHLTHTKAPEPGDIAWFTHNSHYAIVEAVRGNLFDSIDGNQGLVMSRPSIKLHTGRPLTAAAVFYSISKFLEVQS